VQSQTVLQQPARQQTIAGMAVGESAYVPPSALFLTRDRACHIQTDAPACSTLADETSMQVTRTAQGYIADVTYCTFQWETRDWLAATPHAPVVHVVYGDEFLR
jgi:hypothetical protein